MLSKRGIIAQENALRPDLELYFRAAENLYRPDNPEGNFLLNIAENSLCRNILAAKLKEVVATDIPEWVFSYTDTKGHPEFREVMVRFMEKQFSVPLLSSDSLAVAVGAAAIIELTTFCLGDAGDVALIPAPAYSVYTQDIGIKSQLKRVDIPLRGVFDTVTIDLSIESLETAWQNCKREERNVACLILTSPNNPTGRIYDESTLNNLADWCIDKKVHLIVNEIYGLSTLDTAHPSIQADYPTDLNWSSFLKIIQKRQSPYLHWWYALSKDFGISGFRVGMLYSENKDLIQAFSNICVPHMISNHTQWLLTRVFADEQFVDSFVAKNRQQLTNSYVLVTETLRNIGVKFATAFGSLFVWIDLRAFLEEESQKGELELWEAIFENTGILLTPGIGCGHEGYGYYRIVYTAVSYDELKIALKRFENYIHKIR